MSYTAERAAWGAPPPLGDGARSSLRGVVCCRGRCSGRACNGGAGRPRLAPGAPCLLLDLSPPLPLSALVILITPLAAEYYNPDLSYAPWFPGSLPPLSRSVGRSISPSIPSPLPPLVPLFPSVSPLVRARVCPGQCMSSIGRVVGIHRQITRPSTSDVIVSISIFPAPLQLLCAYGIFF